MSVDSKAREDTTIRVSKATRDVFATEAEDRRISMGELLDDIAKHLKRERLYAEARKAAELDENNPEWIAELELWSEADLDGID
jgi:hypothetical protein